MQYLGCDIKNIIYMKFKVEYPVFILAKCAKTRRKLKQMIQKKL